MNDVCTRFPLELIFATIMKIAIVGGGISGLSTYLFLEQQLAKDERLKDAFDITIFEPHDIPRLGNERADDIPSSGGGYGLAGKSHTTSGVRYPCLPSGKGNGMASLRRLSPTLHDQILRNGFPSPKFVMKSARGWSLGVMPFTDLRGAPPECCVMVLREVFVAALYERIPASVIVQHKVLKVEDGNDQAIIELDNGEILNYDLVVGADGVWSKARCAVLGDKYPPEYR